ncbi:DUF21 domain-containing protein At4g33700-like [Patiria miniata]|uniref:CNNM transmembrane domain-containing protein n=1 Tax=Patiria miniata TaxID=46514 RepID=A0A914A870_PATMI|nr:DUF21 domain-containing protein At4g33700-like [Patiria miniata]XP_038059619.1 DUF21 domain-containing protein At4g33700-like [Patiria miniata]
MFEGASITCTQVDPETIICNGTTFKETEPPLDYHDEMFWVYVGIYCALVLFAGLMSGLTMGLLSLDILSLRVLAEGGKPHEQRYARRITPIVERHHLLLVTLLLANAGAVESMPIFLGKVTNEIIAIVVSVTAVLLFGEVVPQAICTRYGLAIGAWLSPLVVILMILFFPIAWPISKVLDCILGHEHGTFFRRAELSAMVSIHKEKQQENEEPLTEDEVLIIQGALSMRNKVVKDALVPLESIFMLDAQRRMDAECMEKVFVKGPYSRIPVYKGHRGNILGILLVKTLVKVDPNTAPTVGEIFREHGRTLPTVPGHLPLYDLLNEMQTGKCHMAAVTSSTDTAIPRSPLEGADQVDSFSWKEGDILGIITLEDIIEELLQEEIVDETDEFVDVHRRVRVARAKMARTQSVQQDTGIIESGAKRPRAPSSSAKSPGIRNEPIFQLGRNVHYAKGQGSEATRGNPSMTSSVNAVHEEEDRTSDTSPLISLE